MSGYCNKSCNRCSSAATCSDDPPNSQYTCAQQVRTAMHLHVGLKCLLHQTYAARYVVSGYAQFEMWLPDSQ